MSRAEVMPCDTTGCTPDCLDSCAEKGCSVQRKHFRRGGVCCGSCYDFCTDCGGSFYWEGLTLVGTTTDEDGDEIERRLCHCCRLADDLKANGYVLVPADEYERLTDTYAYQESLRNG